MKEKLMKICKQEKLNVDTTQHDLESFDKFPYIPYIPKEWNRILVLAESQQLRGTKDGNAKYRNNLIHTSECNQIMRLGNKEITNESSEFMLGIWPWDNGLIKMGLLAALPNEVIDSYGVSNAVPWHLNKKNKSQSKFLKELSISFWHDVLPVLKPKIIICTGEIAKNIILKTKFCVEKNKCRQFNVRSASQLHFVAKKDFEIQDYPELMEIYNINYNNVKRNQPQRYYIWYMNHFKNIIYSDL